MCQNYPLPNQVKIMLVEYFSVMLPSFFSFFFNKYTSEKKSQSDILKCFRAVPTNLLLRFSQIDLAPFLQRQSLAQRSPGSSRGSSAVPYRNPVRCSSRNSLILPQISQAIPSMIPKLTQISLIQRVIMRSFLDLFQTLTQRSPSPSTNFHGQWSSTDFLNPEDLKESFQIPSQRHPCSSMSDLDHLWALLSIQMSFLKWPP